MTNSLARRGVVNEKTNYFTASLFQNNANFEDELGHLFEGNLPEPSLRFALQGLRRDFRGARNARIVAALALAWSVPIPAVCASFMTLPRVKQEELNGIVDRVVAIYHADGTIERLLQDMKIRAPSRASMALTGDFDTRSVSPANGEW